MVTLAVTVDSKNYSWIWWKTLSPKWYKGHCYNFEASKQRIINYLCSANVGLTEKICHVHQSIANEIIHKYSSYSKYGLIALVPGSPDCGRSSGWIFFSAGTPNLRPNYFRRQILRLVSCSKAQIRASLTCLIIILRLYIMPPDTYLYTLCIWRYKFVSLKGLKDRWRSYEYVDCGGLELI